MKAWQQYKALIISKVWMLALSFGLISCREPVQERDDFGLVKIELSLDSDDLAEINSEVFLKRPVPCRIQIGSSTYQGSIRYAGQGSLDDYKKSYEISFGNGSYHGFSALRLNGQSLDPSGLRSLLATSIMSDAGVRSPAIEPVAVYLQEQYLGLYFFIENVDRRFFERRALPYASLYKAYLSQATFAPETAANLPATWNIQTNPSASGDLRRLIEAVNDADPASDLTQLDTMLDIEGFLRYLAAATFLNHTDGIVNNFILWRPKGSKRFQVVAWDFDRIYERRVDSLESLDDLIHNRSRLTRTLLANPILAARYWELLADLRRNLTDDTIEHRLDTQQARIFGAFAKDPVLSTRSGGLAEQRQELASFIRIWLEDLDRQLVQRGESADAPQK